MSPGKHFDNNAECLGDGEKKRGVCLGTDFGLLFQGISNSSSSECHIYLGNYEKSYNNVLFTAFIIGFLGSECSQPPIINRGVLCHLAAGVSMLLAAGTQAPAGPGVLPPQALVSAAGPQEAQSVPHPKLPRLGWHCTLLGPGRSQGWWC